MMQSGERRHSVGYGLAAAGGDLPTADAVPTEAEATAASAVAASSADDGLAPAMPARRGTAP